MGTRGSDQYRLLIDVDQSTEVARVRGVLDLARIPFRSGLLASTPPRVMFYVPASRLEQARDALGRHSDEPEESGDDAEAPQQSAHFPSGAVQLVASVVLLHLGLVLWILGPRPPGRELFGEAGLVPGLVLAQPWRLLTSLFLHSDPAHALWNGLAMLIFGVPLLTRLGAIRTAAIYLIAGAGGGSAAALFALPATVIIGSSGAVAGLFGAWIVVTLAGSRRGVAGWRAPVRILGVGLLFLPSLLNPVSSTGHAVSVSSHMGGLVTGMVIGALISLPLISGRRGKSAESTDLAPAATVPSPD